MTVYLCQQYLLQFLYNFTIHLLSVCYNILCTHLLENYKGYKMDVKSYLERAEFIRKSELMTARDLARVIDISYPTWTKLRAHPETCSIKTMRKLKMFIDGKSRYQEDNNDQV